MSVSKFVVSITRSAPCGRGGLLAFLAGLLFFGCAASPVQGDDALPDPGAEETRANVLDAMQTELKRSSENLELDDYQSPYFIGYRLMDTRDVNLSGKYGAITSDNTTRNRQVYVEVRVGSYEFDNFANVDSQNFRYEEYSPESTAPLDSDVPALRGTLWLLTDQAYKTALSDFLAKKGGAVFEASEEETTPSFSKAESQNFRGEATPIRLDKKRWREIIRRQTNAMLESESLVDSSMSVNARRVIRYLTTSEGTNIIEERTIYSVQMQVWTRADDGMLLDNGRTFYALSPDALPTESELTSARKEVVSQIEKLREAPIIDPYSGPAILMPEASGVLFHEAIGHRLEGERQRDSNSGQTFKGQVDTEIIPEFLSVYDDPTRETFEEHQLNGFYHYDDEGVPAQRVTLVQDGKLKNFLKSRTPIEGAPHSNGHGRAQGINVPMARMANLIVTASSEKSVPYEELKAKLIEEVKRQNKPFGLIIRDITGGSTNTSGWGYQAFKGAPRMIYKVDPETGEETLVRGAELVGTPLTSINKIVGASAERDVFNGYCGAESGYVPVSTVAPALMTTELELQRSQSSKSRPPILPAPWREGSEKPTPKKQKPDGVPQAASPTNSDDAS